MAEQPSEEDRLPPITAERADAILSYLDQFEAADFSPGEWENPEPRLRFFSFSPVVMEFTKALYEHDWVAPSFAWGRWQESAQQYVDSPEKLATADVVTIQKLFTTHVRADRFCEGHLAAMFESGHVQALLRRLRSLRASGLI
jgi:hypothetical protein